LEIFVRRIPMFLGLPDPDPLVQGTDPDPSKSNKQKNLQQKIKFLLPS
jgi:hypothetical protein